MHEPLAVEWSGGEMVNISKIDLMLRLPPRPAAPSAQGPAVSTQASTARLTSLDAAASLSAASAPRPASSPAAAPHADAPQEAPQQPTRQPAAPQATRSASAETRAPEPDHHTEPQTSARQAALAQDALPPRVLPSAISPPMAGGFVPLPASAAPPAPVEPPRAELVPPHGGRVAREREPAPPAGPIILLVMSVLALTAVLLGAL